MALKIDQWIWGRELILWGFDPSHKYTFKVLEPKRGRPGCLSLQYHNDKSESWLVLRGSVWALVVSDGVVCTRIMRPGDVQNISPGMIHRLMGISDDARIAEPSTPDKHAADKSVTKDVIRLHCVLGREVAKPRNETEAKLIETAISYTEEAILAIEKGEAPKEHNLTVLFKESAFTLP